MHAAAGSLHDRLARSRPRPRQFRSVGREARRLCVEFDNMADDSPPMFNSVPPRLQPHRPPENKSRTEHREGVDVNIFIRSRQQRAGVSYITDLSCNGCCVNSAGQSLRVGQPVSVKLPTLEYIPGVVRWVESEKAGIEFSKPLHRAVFEHIAAKIGKVSS